MEFVHSCGFLCEAGFVDLTCAAEADRDQEKTSQKCKITAY